MRPVFFMIGGFIMTAGFEFWLVKSGLWIWRWAPDLSMAVWALSICLVSMNLETSQKRWIWGSIYSVVAGILLGVFVYWLYALEYPETFDAFINKHAHSGLFPEIIISDTESLKRTLRPFWFGIAYPIVNATVYLITGLIFSWICGIILPDYKKKSGFVPYN
ncbi:MAG: hypothetical protein GXO48_09645 [Chlorobi bacterium]|nr:hypothetical protein [Chlorobiota bacterium]